MNIGLFFEGTGRGVAGKMTNVTRLRDLCVEDARQMCRTRLWRGDGEEAGLGMLESIGVGSARRAGRGKIEKAGGSVA